jgi:hypothetical protein
MSDINIRRLVTRTASPIVYIHFGLHLSFPTSYAYSSFFHYHLLIRLSAFSGALPVLPAEPSPGDQTLLLALEALQAMDYPHAFSLANEAVDQDISFDAGRAEAFNLRGTFRYDFIATVFTHIRR